MQLRTFLMNHSYHSEARFGLTEAARKTVDTTRLRLTEAAVSEER